MKRCAIIGGTGVYSAFEEVREEKVLTAYGEVHVEIAKLADEKEIIFLARHGKAHQTPPHKINYHANIIALKMLDVTHILSTCAVGSMNDEFEPGDMMIINDFIDFTKGRSQTYFEGDDQKVAHVEMTEPYCNYLRAKLYEYASQIDVKFKGEGVYVCTEGPRFETASEIKMYKLLGGDVVGMTNIPESVLAKELGMCYQAVGVITNWCTGIEGKVIEGHQIKESMEKNKEKLTKLFVEVFSHDLTKDNCKCDKSLLVL